MWPVILNVASTLKALKFTGSHVHCKCGNIMEMVHDRDIISLLHWNVTAAGWQVTLCDPI